MGYGQDESTSCLSKAFKQSFATITSLIFGMILSLLTITIIAIPTQIISLIFWIRYSYVWCCKSRKPRRKTLDQKTKARLAKLRNHSEGTTSVRESTETLGSDKLLIKTLENDPSYTSILLQTPDTHSILRQAGSMANTESIVLIGDK